ncbi:YhcN/YlaJ family sporulation lipoprotein, partial [Bacillus mycoides]|uniref:YhcN/YlaJ family sporulation lipoprotein n=1 Tax=Bacillus mycoides TaxID=1405 RepID=UPI0016434284
NDVVIGVKPGNAVTDEGAMANEIGEGVTNEVKNGNVYVSVKHDMFNGVDRMNRGVGNGRVRNDLKGDIEKLVGDIGGGVSGRVR